MTKLGRVLGEHADRTVRIFVDLAHEVREVSLTGPRARRCLITAVAVALSVTIAQAMHLPYVWWAGISGFMSAQATLPADGTPVPLIGIDASATPALMPRNDAVMAAWTKELPGLLDRLKQAGTLQNGTK